MLNLSPSSLDWALAHAQRSGDTDIFPLAFEYEAIKHDWDAIRGYLSSADVLTWAVRSRRECLSPKSFNGFRIATQIDPLDWLVFTALVYEMGERLEAYRLPILNEVVYSSRFDPQADGTMYSRNTGYAEFRQRMQVICDAMPNGYVVVTDIADFFPRLYHHRIDNALRSASPSQVNNAKALIELFGNWRGGQSFGIPVGPSASRLVAEVAIDDVDKLLLAEGLVFVRYVDDYRFFCNSTIEAHGTLATLANALWRNHSLTLSEQKTRVIPVSRFACEYLRTELEEELEGLSESFAEILDALGIDDWYAQIEYDDLSQEQKNAVDALNLEDLLDRQLERDAVDVRFVRFLLRRLGQLQRTEDVNKILDSIDKLYPVFMDVIAYLGRLESLTSSERAALGKRLLGLLDGSLVSHLEYHRMHLLSLFAENADWNNIAAIYPIMRRFPDSLTRRKAILAMGKAGYSPWFRMHKGDWQDFPPWERRALLHGASSMEADERRHWYKSIQGGLDPLERAVVKWSQSNPIAS